MHKLISRGRRFLILLLFAMTLAIAIPAQTLVNRLLPAPTPGVGDQAVSDEIFRQLLYLPAPTPSPEGPSEEEKAQNNRPPDFYDKDKAPPDDAPVEDLIDYWEQVANNLSRESRKPTDRVRERLLAACETEPEKLSGLLSSLPDTKDATERIKKLYDTAQGDPHFDEAWRKSVRVWLEFNSRYFVSELLGLAQRARDKKGYVDKEEELKALAKVDWESAMPLLQSMSGGGQPRTASLVLTLLYRHALEEKDSGNEEKYRSRLLAIASDRSAPARARDTAIEELSVSEWPGRDEWYLSLFTDETLLRPTDGSNLFSSLTTLFDHDPDKWIPVMAKLVESKDRAVQQNAASCLVRYATDHPRRDAILPVLRWLSDPDWLDINGTQRSWFMQKMDALDMPESVPGLIWIVENEESNRMWAARTLAYYKDPRAIPALKKALAQEKDENYRQYFIQGLLASGGISDAEQLAALEAYAEKISTAEGREALERYHLSDDDPPPLPVSIGMYLAQQQKMPDALVRQVLVRVESLRRTNPDRVRSLLGVAQGWQARQVELDMVRRIGEGSADAALIENALQRRAKLRETVDPELRSILGVEGTAPGVAAVLLTDAGAAQSILGKGKEQAQVALLACARLVQMPLPVAQIGVLLKSRNKSLSFAAERYLLAEDSREARGLLWEHYPRQAFITGWRENIELIGGSNFSAMDRAEEKLRAEILKKDDAPSEIFALLGNDEQPARVLRVYPQKAVYIHNEDASRYRERVITSEELARFKNFITTNNLTEFGPQFGPCHYDCWASEFLSLTSQGGRRVFSHQGLGSWMVLLANFDFLERGGSKIHYRLADDLKGLEVLISDEDVSVRDVWQRGPDVRVLVERERTLEDFKQEAEESADNDDDEEDEATVRAKQQLEIERAKARFSWRVLTGDKLGALTSQPEVYSTFDETAFDIDDDEFPSNLNSHSAQAVAGNYMVLAGDLIKGGLWKKAAGGNAIRINNSEGVYADPLITPDGQWVVAAQTDTHWGHPNDVIRLNLKTGREYRINLPPAEQFEPVTYLSIHGKVLLRRARDGNDNRESAGPAAPEFYLLDAATGQTQLVTGVFEPLLQESKRFLQSTGKPDEFWAAIPDRQKNLTQVGRYSLRDFSFRTLLVVPHLTFDSSLMWVDETGAKLYIIYEGQLLRLPLPSTLRTKASEK